jgi:hypothetical protein
MTPQTSPERFTEREAAAFERGECCWETRYGTIEGIVFCCNEHLPGFHLCSRHAREVSGARPSDAQRRTLEVYENGGGPGESWASERTIESMSRHGWIDANGITDKGAAALAVARFTAPRPRRKTSP